MITLKYLKKHSNIVTFLLTILVIGIILGLILGIKQDTIFKNDVVTSLNGLQNLLLTKKINNILNHFITFSILIVTSFIVPLSFLNYIIILFKGLSIGFTLYIFTITLGFKGFFYGLIYNLITNLLFCLIYIFLIIRGMNISKNFISFILTHDNKWILNVKKTLLGIIILISVCLGYDIVLFLFSNFVIDKLIWLF